MIYTSCAPKFFEGSGWLWHAEWMPPWPILLTGRVCWSISLWEVVKINDISLPFTPRDHSVILPPEKAICKAHRVALAIKKEQKSKAKLFLQGKDTTLGGLCALLWFPNTYYAHKTETTPLLAFSLQGLYLSSPWVLSYCFYPTFCSMCFETRMGRAHTDVCKG